MAEFLANMLYLAAGLVWGSVFAIMMTKDRWVHPDTLREAHWAQDEKNRWEIRTGRRLSFDEVSVLRDALASAKDTNR